MSRGYASLQLPYSGTSGYQKHETTLTPRQLNMVSKLEETGREFLDNNKPMATTVKRAERRVFKSGVTNPSLDVELKTSLHRYQSSRESERMTRFRQTLPVFQYKAEINNHVQENQVFVLSGETGCGKTTQVTQFILDQAIEAGEGSRVSIVCTQPRRVAAISVADRVAMERGESLGHSVGYQVKMDARIPRNQGSILYCTGGILLQRLQSDRQLLQFSHIILDEVHERDVMTDIILVLLKEILAARPNVKVLLMSATLNGEQFSRFFNNCPVLHIPGFMHPVQSFYLKDVLEKIEYAAVPEPGRDEEEFFQLTQSLQAALDSGDNQLENLENFQINIIAALIEKIHSEKEEGGILVFLPGWEDICRLMRILDDISLEGLRVFPLHGSMSHDDQRLIFQPAIKGMRKIVIGTNIAESSVTIDDVVFVIDCGRAKMKMFDPEKNFATLKPEWISKANCTQRKGRAGRLRPGKVYRIFSREREETFREYMLPEILRTRLENVILKIKILDFVDLEGFLNELLDCPRREAVDLAIESLVDIGAMTPSGNLTSMGKILANLATDPQLGKMMILGCTLSCLDPILTVVAALEYKSPFYITKNREAAKAMDTLSCETMSDHLAVANAFAGWCSARMNRRTPGLENQALDFCKENCLSQAVLHNMERLKAQYATELSKMGLIPSKDMMDPKCNSNSGVEAVVRAVITVGLLPNMAVIKSQGDTHSLINCKEQPLEFHPKSVNREVLSRMQSSLRSCYTPRWYVYFEKMHTSDTFLNDSTSANLLTLVLLASNLRMVDLTNPHEDPTISSATREKLGIRGDTVEEDLVDLRMSAGEQSLRLLVCRGSEARRIGFVRTVLDRILQERIEGGECGSSNPKSPHGKVLSLLSRVLHADSTK